MDDVGLLVHRAPQAPTLILNGNEQFIDTPDFPESPLFSPNRSGRAGPELPATEANRLLGDDDDPFWQPILDATETQGEP